MHSAGTLLAAGADHRRADTADMADRAAFQDRGRGDRSDAVSGVRDTELPVQVDGKVLTGGPELVRTAKPAVYPIPSPSSSTGT